MKMRSIRLILAAVAFNALAATPGSTLETMVVDGACHLDGFAKPLRQTIVVIDQLSIIPTTAEDIGDANRRWLNTVLSIAGVQEGQASVIAAPRERLTVVVASEDGGDLIRVFTGCSPIYSQDEIAEMKKSSTGIRGGFEWFIGKDVQNRVENELKSFRSKLTDALAELPKMTRPKEAAVVKDGTPLFLEAFALLSSSIDLGEGVPRVFVLSAMNSEALRSFKDVKTARSKGFELAERVGGDLQRAEVYVNGVSGNSGKFARDFSHAFFLGIKGRLAGISGESLPAVSDPPRALQVFSGVIDYGGVKAPMQIRLASDRSGSLVNSWVEVTVKRPTATPLTGKALCKNPETCDVTGDGKEFAQAWVLDPSADTMSKFDESLPFSGVRYFEFTTSQAGAKGRAYDPLVTSINGRKELSFGLSRTPMVRF